MISVQEIKFVIESALMVIYCVHTLIIIISSLSIYLPGKQGTTVMSWQQSSFGEKKQSWLQEHSIGDGPTVQTLAFPTQHSVKPASTHEAPERPFPLPLPLPLPNGGMLSAASSTQ